MRKNEKTRGDVPCWPRAAGHARQLVDDLWQEYERAVKRLRKISVRANDAGSSCFRCGARWSQGEKEHHALGCVLKGTEP